MSDLFDFGNLKKLVVSSNPSALILVDTNVLMDNPDFLQWHSDLDNPVFILAYSTIVELARLKDKQKIPAQEKAINAIRALVQLSRQGTIGSGISLDKNGWLITVPVPSKAMLEPKFDKLNTMLEVNREADTIMLILHKELQVDFPKIPVISLTGDRLYEFFANDIGLLVYPSQSFPLAITEWLAARSTKVTINLDIELTEAIHRLEKKLIKVQLTLISKRLDRDYNMGSDDDPRIGTLIAEGEGVLHHPELGIIGFLWKLLYKPGPSRVLALHPEFGEADIYNGYASNLDILPIPFINYLGRDQEVPESLQSLISEKLVYLADPAASPIASPSLQSALCINEYYMRFILAINSIGEDLENKGSPGDLSEKKDDILANGFASVWNDPYIFDSFDDFHEFLIENISKYSKDQLSHFADKMMSVWNVGHTIEFLLPPEDI